jgi:hypothetical protein
MPQVNLDFRQQLRRHQDFEETYCSPIMENVNNNMRIDSVEPFIEGSPEKDAISSVSSVIFNSFPST